MKKPVKVILIVSGAVLAVVLGFLAFAGIAVNRATSSMVPVASGEVLPGVFAVRDGIANFWLVETTDGYLAFDAGNSVKVTGRELATLGIDPLSVSAVFLTHTDKDHVAAIGLFKNAAVYIGSEEEQMINGTTNRFPGMKNSLKVDYLTVEDSESVLAGDRIITAILTPGHTPGHTCWLLDGSYLFTGDTLGLKEGKVTLAPGFFNMDTEKEGLSLKKLARSADPDYLFTGHFGWTETGSDTFSAFR
jgi:glyoxylase-like metal-dependent hydrolase (beta-lactamase superfamily II)